MKESEQNIEHVDHLGRMICSTEGQLIADVLEITDSSDHPIGRPPHASLIPGPYLAQYERWRGGRWGHPQLFQGVKYTLYYSQ